MDSPDTTHEQVCQGLSSKASWLQEAGADAGYVEAPRSIDELKEIAKRQKVCPDRAITCQSNSADFHAGLVGQLVASTRTVQTKALGTTHNNVKRTEERKPVFYVFQHTKHTFLIIRWSASESDALCIDGGRESLPCRY